MLTLKRWTVLSLVLFSLFSFADDLDAVEEPICPIPESIAGSQAVVDYVQTVCRDVAGILDHKTGTGTGGLASHLERMRDHVVTGRAKLTTGELKKAGFTYEELRNFVIQQTGGKGQVIPVMAYSSVVARANRWFRDSGFGFFQVVQDPKAALLETYRNATDRFPLRRGVTAEDVKLASDLAYPENRRHEIRIPVHPEDLKKSEFYITFPTYELVGDPKVLIADDVPLPSYDKPQAKDEWWYGKLQKVRLGLTGFVLASATYFGGGISPEALAVFGAGMVLETQFVFLTGLWRRFWAWAGFKGNALVNFSYGGILASVKHLVEKIRNAPITFDPIKFGIETGVLGASFIGIFGGMQVVSAKMKADGEFMEGGAAALETVGSVLNNFARAFAVTATAVGTHVVAGHIGPVEIGNDVLAALGVQAVFGLLVTAPLWLKRLVGNQARAALIHYDLVGQGDPSHPFNRPLTGDFAQWCTVKVAGLARLYTPRRFQLPWRRSTSALAN